MADHSESLMANFSGRSVDLREPAQEKDILDFESAMGFRLNQSAREIYTLFNGFRFYDRQSQIWLWGLDEIAQKNSGETHLRQGCCLAIGDILIESDFLVTDLSQEAPITLLFEKREVQPNIFDLVLQLSHGNFDFLAANPV